MYKRLTGATLADVLKVLRIQGYNTGRVGQYTVSWYMAAYGWIIRYIHV